MQALSAEAPIVVIGAGVVGLACALHLAQRSHWVLVLEREHAHGRGTSSRNSEVIHAGIYYPSGSLKARLCVEGRRSLYAYMPARGVPHWRCGKLIVATDESQLEQLRGLALRAEANGVEGMEWLDMHQVRRLEPAVSAVAALLSTTTGIVDAHGLMNALYGDACSAGADFAFGMEVLGADRNGHLWRLDVRTPDGAIEQIEAAAVVNSAGLHADVVAALVVPENQMAGLRLNWVKGSYFALCGGYTQPVQRLIYPCPRPDQLGLGVHLTLDLGGAQRLGPDVELLPERMELYDVDSAKAAEFAAAARKFLPEIREHHLRPGYSGLRPQRRMDGFRDFYVAEESARGAPGWVNLVGIESPGLTCALALAAEVSALLEDPAVVCTAAR